MMHSVRQGLVLSTNGSNHLIHGLLLEFGIVYPNGIAANDKLPELLDDAEYRILDSARRFSWGIMSTLSSSTLK